MTGPDYSDPPFAPQPPPTFGVDSPESTPWSAPAGNPPLGTRSALNRLAIRQTVVPTAALAVGIISILAYIATSGGGGLTINHSSDAEVCTAYRAAERSWDRYDSDADIVMDLSAVAKKHADEDIRSAGKGLDNLPMVFTYGQYSKIVQPIARLC